MTKKDFELIARIIRESELHPSDLEKIACDFGDNLSILYPKFQKDKFLKACGVDVKQRCLDCGISLMLDEEVEDKRCSQCEAIHDKNYFREFNK